ncbi:hypothetical protein SBV1_2600007 [Verrucomicrobia bacterium]|nr:hypothetical protein SBV1_2600007 [Verrucomicrobiota bacterium]
MARHRFSQSHCLHLCTSGKGGVVTGNSSRGDEVQLMVGLGGQNNDALTAQVVKMLMTR